MRKSVAARAALALSLIALIAPFGVAESKKVVIQYAAWNDEESYLRPIVDAFNKKDPSVQVKLNIYPSANNSYDDKIKIMLAAMADVDVLGMNSESAMLQYSSTGSLADLSQLIAQSKMDVSVYGPALPKIAQGGKQYGLPYRSSCWFLVYNKALFDKAKIPYPKQMTWDEYVALSSKLTSGSGADKVYGGYMVPWVYYMLSVQRGVTTLDDNTAPLRESLEFYKTIYSNGSHMSLVEQKVTNSDWLAEFEKGRVAMLPHGDWFIGMIKSDEAAGKSDVAWDLAPLPVPKGVAAGTSFGHYTLAGITSFSKVKKEAFSFLSYLCGPEAAKVLAKAGIIPAYNDASVRDAYVKSIGKDSARVIFDAKTLPEQSISPKTAEVNAALSEETELYLLGEKSISETMSSFESRRAKILKR
jgi:ABC-type sugar transport system, periplasmic component